MLSYHEKRDGEAVAASSLELKARGISCSGLEVRIDLMGLECLWQRNGWTVW